MINLTVPAGTPTAGHPPRPGGGWGLTRPRRHRRLLQAPPCTRAPAGASPCSPDGTAAAHGRARGPHPWIRRRTAAPPEPDPTPGRPPRSPTCCASLNVTLTPIAKGSCDHASREDRYTPSRTLKDLIRARTARCTAPGCGAQAAHCDLDHTLPYPAGITCECDLAPACRRHHRRSKHPAGGSPSPNPASCPGPHPPAAATPPSPPSTKCDSGRPMDAPATSLGPGRPL